MTDEFGLSPLDDDSELEPKKEPDPFSLAPDNPNELAPPASDPFGLADTTPFD